MNIYISIDMEGTAGIATSEQCRRGSDTYPVAQRLMTAEANAAIQGAFAAGASRVLVNDSHADMTNLLQEDLDCRAELLLGSPKVPQSMMQGLNEEFDLVFFIGYHSGAGVAHAVRAHTYSGVVFHDVRLNGTSVTEAELNAHLASTYDVPVGLVTGDDSICALAQERLPWVKTVAVKAASGVAAARSLHPERARAAIAEAATAAIADADDLRTSLQPGPYSLEVDLARLEMAELCALVPGSERVSGRTVRIMSGEFVQVFHCLLAFLYLARSGGVR